MADTIFSIILIIMGLLFSAGIITLLILIIKKDAERIERQRTIDYANYLKAREYLNQKRDN